MILGMSYCTIKGLISIFCNNCSAQSLFPNCTLVFLHLLFVMVPEYEHAVRQTVGDSFEMLSSRNLNWLNCLLRVLGEICRPGSRIYEILQVRLH